MKKYSNLLAETIQVEDLEELESAADLMQHGLDKGYYTRLQQQEFNSTYWHLKNKFLAHEIECNFKNTNSLDLIYIVSKAPINIKDNKKQLIDYVGRIIKNLKKSRVA